MQKICREKKMGYGTITFRFFLGQIDTEVHRKSVSGKVLDIHTPANVRNGFQGPVHFKR